MNFSGQQKQLVKPPQRGIFPLDHDGECKIRMREYLQCLDEEKRNHFKCKAFSRAYLQCRMDSDLMAREDLDGVSLSSSSIFFIIFVYNSIFYL